MSNRLEQVKQVRHIVDTNAHYATLNVYVGGDGEYKAVLSHSDETTKVVSVMQDCLEKVLNGGSQ